MEAPETPELEAVGATVFARMVAGFGELFDANTPLAETLFGLL